jgi:uncharacterized membrane protein YccC
VEWEPSGQELVAAAEHAARMAGKYERLASQWKDEALRLADRAADEGGHHGLLGRMAGLIGMRAASFATARKTRRMRNGSGG